MQPLIVKVGGKTLELTPPRPSDAFRWARHIGREMSAAADDVAKADLLHLALGAYQHDPPLAVALCSRNPPAAADAGDEVVDELYSRGWSAPDIYGAGADAFNGLMDVLRIPSAAEVDAAQDFSEAREALAG